MPYKIVKTFERGNSKLSAVPSNWEKDGVLHWPRYNENKLRRLENSCPEDNWRKINCKVKRDNLITFLKAEQELDKMCKKSETDTDTEQNTNFVTNEDMAFQDIIHGCITFDNISPVEAVERQKNDVLCQPDEARNLENSVIVIQPPDINSDSNAQQNVTEVQIDNAALTLMVLEKIETLQENYKTLNEKINEHIKAQQEDRKFINENVQSILLGLSNISVQFEHVMNKFSRPEKNKQTENIQNIASENDLNNFEKVLENPEVEEEWKKKFSVICGKGKGRGVNNAYALVDSMFSRCFLHQCSWAGGSRTSEQKICFKSHTKIINFFFDIVHESDNSYTLLDCHKFFKNILKNSRQRKDSKQIRLSATKNRPTKKARRSSLPITGTSAPENRFEVSLPVVGTSGSENRSEVTFPVVGTSGRENRSEVPLPVIGTSGPENNSEVPLPVIGTSGPENRSEVTFPVVGASGRENRSEVSLPVIGTSGPENRSEVTIPVVGTSGRENRSEVSLPVIGTSGPENDVPIPMSSAPVARIPPEPLETSV